MFSFATPTGDHHHWPSTQQFPDDSLLTHPVLHVAMAELALCSSPSGQQRAVCRHAFRVDTPCSHHDHAHAKHITISHKRREQMVLSYFHPQLPFATAAPHVAQLGRDEGEAGTTGHHGIAVAAGLSGDRLDQHMHMTTQAAILGQ
eukprot:CAMPEP_0173126108 /NCGR_PEP_ID=MMETSP1102-20130122/56878_1 /TAXON_ID=49646 /ORGANISM="Geminigera sp., Strain Caron Lab Isolate" /LENGTH=145 /DNA_ID=CAMNT_0014035229 /DNA_START=104 /DNA_END=542 /DNA_ORIENTATION=-